MDDMDDMDHMDHMDHMDLTGDILAYEQGELGCDETIILFSKLIESGMAWTLQGHYGRTAHMLIRCGFVNPTGTILESGGRSEEIG